MIVVIGSPLGRSVDGHTVAAGVSAAIAIAAAASGGPVQLVGRIGDDAVADAVLADLSRLGVGHVAMLRDAAHPTPLDTASAGESRASEGLPLDAQDVSLALRYLIDVSVLVVTPAAPPAVLAVIADAAGWAGAAVILVGPRNADPPTAAIPVAITVEPTRDEDPVAFAARVAAVAVREATLRSAR